MIFFAVDSSRAVTKQMPGILLMLEVRELTAPVFSIDRQTYGSIPLFEPFETQPPRPQNTGDSPFHPSE